MKIVQFLLDYIEYIIGITVNDNAVNKQITTK
jgi:hypothetical protein